jgi:hypothetical protein
LTRNEDPFGKNESGTNVKKRRKNESNNNKSISNEREKK